MRSTWLSPPQGAGAKTLLSPVLTGWSPGLPKSALYSPLGCSWHTAWPLTPGTEVCHQEHRASCFHSASGKGRTGVFFQPWLGRWALAGNLEGTWVLRTYGSSLLDHSKWETKVVQKTHQKWGLREQTKAYLKQPSHSYSKYIYT